MYADNDEKKAFQADDRGIIPDHAYSILKVYEIKRRWDVIRLIKLRNPWGNYEWEGKWGDKDDNWDDALKKKVGFEDWDDGVFFMEVDDYVQYCECTIICKVQDNYFQNRLKLTHECGDYSLALVTLDTRPRGFAP